MLQRPHIMQSVCKLNDNHTDILCHGKKHLTQVLRLQFQPVRRLPLIVPRQLQQLQLRHAVHQKSHVGAEFLFDFFLRHNGIFHHIMQKPCRNSLLIHLQVSQNNPDAERMDNIRLPRLPHLLFMGIICYLICFFNERNIIGRMISAHMGNKILIQLFRTLEFLDGFDSSVIKHQSFAFNCLFALFFCHIHHRLSFLFL